MQLEIALTQLTNQVDCDEVLFWGKITGQKEDYYIALCIWFKGKYEFPDKTFYWATTKNFKFSQIPDPLEQHNNYAEMSTPFVGDPKFIINLLEVPKEENPDDQPVNPDGGADGAEEVKDDLADSSSDDEIKVPPKNFTELD